MLREKKMMHVMCKLIYSTLIFLTCWFHAGEGCVDALNAINEYIELSCHIQVLLIRISGPAVMKMERGTYQV